MSRGGKKVHRWRNNDLSKNNDINVESSYYKKSKITTSKRLSTSPDYHNTYNSMDEEMQQNHCNIPYFNMKPNIDLNDAKLSKRKSLNFTSNSVRTWFEPLKETISGCKLEKLSGQNNSASPIRKTTAGKNARNKTENQKLANIKQIKQSEITKKNFKKLIRFEETQTTRKTKIDAKGKPYKIIILNQKPSNKLWSHCILKESLS